MTTIAVDLGGTRTKLAFVKDGEVVENHILPSDSEIGLQPQLCKIEKLIVERIDAHGGGLEGVGVAFAGLVNPVDKRVVSANGKYMDAMQFDFAAWGREKFNLPLVLENDANAALLGETAYGCAQGYGDAVMMILGTGVGTAAMINGKLLRGKHFQAGCLGGHLSVSLEGRPCTCGSTDCVEAYASSWALPVIAREQPDFAQSGLSAEEKIDFLALEKWVLRGDALAIRLLDRFNACWSAGIKNLIHAYDPEVVILSGGVIKCGDMIIGPLTQKVLSSVWTPWGDVAVKVAKNPEHSVLLGLHQLIINERN